MYCHRRILTEARGGRIFVLYMFCEWSVLRSLTVLKGYPECLKCGNPARRLGLCPGPPGGAYSAPPDSMQSSLPPPQESTPLSALRAWSRASQIPLPKSAYVLSCLLYCNVVILHCCCIRRLCYMRAFLNVVWYTVNLRCLSLLDFFWCFIVSFL